MADNQVFLTAEGMRELEEKLELYKTVKRSEAAEKLKIARGFGDLSENAEYEAAKDEQARIEAEIAELQATLKNARILEENELNTDTVTLGVKVKLYDTEFDEELIYRILGSAEAHPEKGSISDESPVGKAILGHRVGETVNVEAPGGVIAMKILEIMK